jgi:hypothetical protein
LIGFALVPVDLRLASDFRLHPEAIHVAIDQQAIQLVMLDGMKTRPYGRHPAPKDVDKLLQLVMAYTTPQ